MSDIQKRLTAQCEAQLDGLAKYAMGSWGLDPLETLTVRDDRGDLRRVEVLACCGGPTVWLDVYPDGYVRARGYWGSASVEVVRAVESAWDVLAE